MNEPGLREMSVEQLVVHFADLALQQDDSMLGGEIARYNRLFDRISQVKAELKGRPGDQRRAVTALYDHPNPQVRLNAAHATLALFANEARAVLQAIADSNEYPHNAEARGTLRNLDEGIYKPT